MRGVQDLQIINFESSLGNIEQLTDEELKELYKFVYGLYFHMDSEKELSFYEHTYIIPRFFRENVEELFSLVSYVVAERFCDGKCS